MVSIELLAGFPLQSLMQTTKWTWNTTKQTKLSPSPLVHRATDFLSPVVTIANLETICKKRSLKP